MFSIGQIVADIENNQLVMYLGMDKVKGKLCLVYVNEETYNNIFVKKKKHLKAKDCLTSLELVSHIGAIPLIVDDFATAKKAIANANGRASTQYSRWGENDEPDSVYYDYFNLTVVDDVVVFIKDEGLSGKPNEIKFLKEAE